MASEVTSEDADMAATTENTEPEFLNILREASKYKVRSSETHDTVHAPLLQTAVDQPIDLVLLGDSMFERFKTTGKTTILGSDNTVFPTIMNAGVGGDRIVNVVYRLVEKGLLFSLQQRVAVKNIMIQMGTNDIANDKSSVRDSDIELYALIIESLRWASAGVKIGVCGINPRLRVKREDVVEVSNQKLEAMVEDLRAKGWDDVTYIPSNPTLINHLDEDGLHLNEKGYELFADALWKNYQMMKRTDQSTTVSVVSAQSRIADELNKTAEFEGWQPQ